jgi:hypothetical protein
MSLLNPAILWGLLLVSVPVILHFLLRARPKKLLFPALRLVRARRKSNVRRLRLKHVWLLLLRMGVLALIVGAIARPTLPAANYRPSAMEWLTTLAIVGVALAVYFWFIRIWKQRRLPNHLFQYRSTLLRAGAGLAALVLFLLLVVLPYQHRIAAEISSPLPAAAQNLPVAAVFVFDTSLSMSYRLQNLTRLEAAEQIAGEHLGRLPTGSRVAVADTSTDMPLVFQAEHSGALDRIQKLQTRGISLPLADRIHAALSLQEEDFKRTVTGQESVAPERRRDRFVREIYLFTDLAVGGWRKGDLKGLKAQLERLPTVSLYIIDVGVEKPTNAAINAMRLSSPSVPKGTDLIVDATVDVVGFETDAERTIEIHVQNEKGQLVKREQRTINPTSGKPAAASFLVGGLSRATTQGELRLISSDPYSVDDIRYFTVSVTPPVNVLVVGESKVETNFIEQALAPAELVTLGKARYNVKYLPATRLSGDADLTHFDVVFLVNVASPSQAAWTALGQFVNGGGGLFVVAGNGRLTLGVTSYNSDAAQAVLPARLRGQVRFSEPTALDLRDFNHPLFKKFQFYEGGFGDLTTVRIDRRWGVEPGKAAGVIVTYTDALFSPALIGRVVGKGRSLLLTTGLDRKGWSDLPLTGWRFMALLDQIVRYLSRQTETTANALAGEDVAIAVPPDVPLRGYFLRKPGLEQLPGEIAAGAKSIVLRNLDQVGQYEIISRDEKVPFLAGFSANAPPEESDFSRVSRTDLDQLLGEGRYSVARSIEGLTRNVAFGRIGQEVFSLVLGIAIAVFCAEHFVANRFYDAEQSPEPRASKA